MRENKRLLFIAVFIPFFLFYYDEIVLTWVREFHRTNPAVGDLLRAADRAMYFAAHGTTMIVGAAVLYLFGKYINRRFYEVGKSLLIGLATSGIVVQILKHLIGRARPRVTDSLLVIGPSFRGSYDSFPSGHTAMAFCLAYILSRHFPAYRVLFYLFAVLEGLARIDGTSHFPSDVLAGVIVGSAIAAAVTAIMDRREAREPNVKEAGAGSQ